MKKIYLVLYSDYHQVLEDWKTNLYLTEQEAHKKFEEYTGVSYQDYLDGAELEYECALFELDFPSIHE